MPSTASSSPRVELDATAHWPTSSPTRILGGILAEDDRRTRGDGRAARAGRRPTRVDRRAGRRAGESRIPHAMPFPGSPRSAMIPHTPSGAPTHDDPGNRKGADRESGRDHRASGRIPSVGSESRVSPSCTRQDADGSPAALAVDEVCPIEGETPVAAHLDAPQIIEIALDGSAPMRSIPATGSSRRTRDFAEAVESGGHSLDRTDARGDPPDGRQDRIPTPSSLEPGRPA